MTNGDHRITPAKTIGEQLFEDYLSGRGMGWAYEEDRSAGETRPDYRLETQPGVLVEVKDFAETDADRSFRESKGLRGVESYGRIRDKIDKAKKKFKDHRGRGLACVLVLHNSGAALVHLRSEIVAGAMHGDMGFTIQVGGVEIKPEPHFDKASARLRENVNTTISAVAIVERFQPNADLLQSEIQKRIGPPEVELTEDTIRRVLDAMEAARADRPEIDFDQVVCRVRVVHNPHARIPLDTTIFNGPYDEQVQANLLRLGG